MQFLLSICPSIVLFMIAASKNTTFVVLMVQLGAEDPWLPSEEQIAFRRQQHPDHRGREVDPKPGPEPS